MAWLGAPGAAPVDCPGRCWVESVWLADADASDSLDGIGAGSGIGGAVSRASAMSGGAFGAWPLISSGPFALLRSVAQPPSPSVAPMLHATWWLPAAQLGNEMVL
jgi:hypothetical protein